MKNLIFAILLSIGLWSCVTTNKNVDLPEVYSGEIVRIDSFESQFVTPRNVDVWLPDNYSSDKQYSVVYMHDGQMLFDSTVTWNKQEWCVDEMVSTLMAENKIKDCIIVGVWNSVEGRHGDYFPAKVVDIIPDTLREKILADNGSDYFPNGLQSDNYLNFLVTELKPYIDENFSVYTDKDNTIIIGSSMGGLISMYAICEYPDVFGGAGCMSTHWPGITGLSDNPIPQAFAAYMNGNLPDYESHKMYFDFGTGTLDTLYEPSQKIIDSVMINRGYSSENWKTLKFEGHNHTERSWSKRLNEPLEFLIGKE